jgi:hypothetical protein
MPDGTALSPAAVPSALPSSAVRSPHADDLPAPSGPPPDPWPVPALDLDGYLSRVGLAGTETRPPGGGTLAALHAAHLAAFPFENLDIMLGRGVRVDLGSIQAKLVGGRRGGYCFEHGQLLGAALERLGFGVERMLARVWRPDMTGARTHLTLRVTVGGSAGSSTPASAPPWPGRSRWTPAARRRSTAGPTTSPPATTRLPGSCASCRRAAG